MRLLIHGGCGGVAPGSAKESEIRQILADSLQAGWSLLRGGADAADAVVASIRAMEDAPAFNAGRGAVFTTARTNQLDAGIMIGRTGQVGGVSSLSKIRNPILGALAVLSRTPHSLLCGRAADEFCAANQLTEVDPSYFATDFRLRQLESVLAKGDLPKLDHDLPTGTVGAVALDGGGGLASGSSTGGRTGCLPGRVSDSAVAGAGFYATAKMAVSMTGNGDAFIQEAAARRLIDLVELGSLSLADASDMLIHDTLKDVPAGLIALDAQGNYCMPFNTKLMYRAVVGDGLLPVIDIV